MPPNLPLTLNNPISYPLFIISSVTSLTLLRTPTIHLIHLHHHVQDPPSLVLSSRYTNQLWQFSEHLVTCVAPGACAMNASMLSLHGDEVPPTMTASSLRPIPMLMGLRSGYCTCSPIFLLHFPWKILSLCPCPLVFSSWTWP